MRIRQGSVRVLAAVIASMAGMLLLTQCAPAGEPASPVEGGGPFVTAFSTISTTNPATGSEIVADIHLPTDATASVGAGGPMPVLVFVPGTSTPRSAYSGNAQNLATWGFLVALPGMPKNDVEVRASDIKHLLDHLEVLNRDRDSGFFRTMDLGRVGITGHSLGGVAPLMIAARGEPSVLAAIALDPVNPDGNDWDYVSEGRLIDAPVVLIGAPPHTCNWFARYREMYPELGADHKAMILIQDGGHCDFLDPGVPLAASVCGLICGGYSEGRLALVERYAAAWFSYYVRLDTDFHSVLYGPESDADLAAGLIERTYDTAPRDVRAISRGPAIELTWTAYDHPVVAGYNVYRSQASDVYYGSPYAELGRTSSFVDLEAVPGRAYYYVIASRDAAGNEHQPSAEVSAIADPATAGLVPPVPGS